MRAIAILLAATATSGSCALPSQLPVENTRPAVVLLVTEHDEFLTGAVEGGSWTELPDELVATYLEQSAAWLELFAPDQKYVSAYAASYLGEPVMTRLEAWTVERYPWDATSGLPAPLPLRNTLRTIEILRDTIQKAAAP